MMKPPFILSGCTIRVIYHRDFCNRLFDRLQNMLYLLHCISRKNHFAALFALHAGNILDNDNAVLELYRVDRRAGLHFAFAEQTNHKHTALTARTGQSVCQ